jgi:streptomycin 6-kinase
MWTTKTTRARSKQLNKPNLFRIQQRWILLPRNKYAGFTWERINVQGRNDGGARIVTSLATAEAQDEVERGLLLDVVVRQGAAVLQLLAGEDEALLVRRDALLVLDLGLNVVDGVRALQWWSCRSES